jgi:ribonuclease BN (tRNA processing enzyme)
VTRLATGADVLVSEVQREDQIRQFVKRIGEQNRWPPERTAAFMDHMTREHLMEKDTGAIASGAHVKALVLYHYDAADASAAVAAVKKYFAGPVFGSVDLARYCLGPQPGSFGACSSTAR